MKTLSLISTGVLVLLLGATAPTYAQDPKPEQETKPPKQEEPAKPKEEPKKPKPAKPEPQPAKGQEPKQQKQEQLKPAKDQQQQENKQPQAEPQQRQPQGNAQQNEKAQGQWAHNGQKDNRGHEYNDSKFGRDHHARFEQQGGRSFNGRREYSYGGYWFYAGAYPPWFYQQDVYFVMGPDGLWYAVAYGDPSLTFQVYIE
jgi:hypothetical protein